MELRILIVDDDLPVLNALKRSLSLHYDLVEANSGPNALDIIRDEGPFHVIVSDLRMRKMDGVEFVTLAKKASPDSYFVILTGNQDQSAVDYVQSSGVVDCMLHKPSTKDDLVAAIEQGRIALLERIGKRQSLDGGNTHD